MVSIAKDTIGGFNTFLKEQQEVPGKCSFTLHQFNHEFNTVVKSTDIKNVAPLNEDTFVPTGNTALLDAIGRAVVEKGKELASLPEKQRPDKVVVVIITDGEENCSKGFKRPKIFDMIKHQTEVYKWEFVFLAANQDAIKSGGLMGVVAANSVDFGSQTTAHYYAVTSSNLAAFRSGTKQDMSYTTKQKQDLKK